MLSPGNLILAGRSRKTGFGGIHGREGGCLGQDILNNVRLFNSRKALVQPLILKGELIVIDAQLVKNRGIHVTNMDGVFDDVVAVVVSLTVFEPAFYSGPSHPH